MRRSLAIAAVLAALAAACGTSNQPVARPAPATSTTLPAWASPPASGRPSPTPAYTGVRLDERSACVLAVPMLQQALDAVATIEARPDGSTVDQAKLDGTITALRRLVDAAPADMRDDLTNVLHPLEQIRAALDGHGARTIDTDRMRLSGQALTVRCRKYANG